MDKMNDIKPNVYKYTFVILNEFILDKKMIKMFLDLEYKVSSILIVESQI